MSKSQIDKRKLSLQRKFNKSTIQQSVPFQVNPKAANFTPKKLHIDSTASHDIELSSISNVGNDKNTKIKVISKNKGHMVNQSQQHDSLDIKMQGFPLLDQSKKQIEFAE